MPDASVVVVAITWPPALLSVTGTPTAAGAAAVLTVVVPLRVPKHLLGGVSVTPRLIVLAPNTSRPPPERLASPAPVMVVANGDIHEPGYRAGAGTAGHTGSATKGTQSSGASPTAVTLADTSALALREANLTRKIGAVPLSAASRALRSTIPFAGIGTSTHVRPPETTGSRDSVRTEKVALEYVLALGPVSSKLRHSRTAPSPAHAMRGTMVPASRSTHGGGVGQPRVPVIVL